MSASCTDLRATALLNWMLDRVGDGGAITFRNVLRLGPSATRRLAAAEAAIGTLARHGQVEEVACRPRVIQVRARESNHNMACDAATVATVPGTKAETGAPAAALAALPENSASGAPTVATSRENPAISASGPTAWHAALVALPPDRDPCRGFEPGAWTRVRAAALGFVEEHGDKAAALGWQPIELFGGDRLDGIGRPSSCGALMACRGSPVTHVRAAEIRFSNRLSFRRAPMPATSTPVWDFARLRAIGRTMSLSGEQP
jgi:hypothetical protein